MEKKDRFSLVVTELQFNFEKSLRLSWQKTFASSPARYFFRNKKYLASEQEKNTCNENEPEDMSQCSAHVFRKINSNVFVVFKHKRKTILLEKEKKYKRFWYLNNNVWNLQKRNKIAKRWFWNIFEIAKVIIIIVYLLLYSVQTNTKINIWILPSSINIVVMPGKAR